MSRNFIETKVCYPHVYPIDTIENEPYLEHLGEFRNVLVGDLSHLGLLYELCQLPSCSFGLFAILRPASKSSTRQHDGNTATATPVFSEDLHTKHFVTHDPMRV